MTDGTTLRVTMLGDFALQYGPEPVRLKKRQSAKPVRLPQMLIYRRAPGIPRQGLIDALYGAETGVDTANNLNATVSQLRRLLRNTILPEENYICTEVDRYRFQSSFPVLADAQELYREVEKLYHPPPERMLQRIRTSAGDSLLEGHSVRTIRDRLDEAGREGHCCLPFPSFLDAYLLISRMSGAVGQPVSLMLCTLRGSDSRSRPDRELFRAAMEQLKGPCARRCARRTPSPAIPGASTSWS